MRRGDPLLPLRVSRWSRFRALPRLPLLVIFLRFQSAPRAPPSIGGCLRMPRSWDLRQLPGASRPWRCSPQLWHLIVRWVGGL